MKFIDPQKLILASKSPKDVFRMLKTLNNCEHTVYTAFCLHHQNKARSISKIVQTKVCFKDCTDEEFKWYIETKEPFGKAGAYVIQEKGAFIELI